MCNITGQQKYSSMVIGWACIFIPTSSSATCAIRGAPWRTFPRKCLFTGTLRSAKFTSTRTLAHLPPVARGRSRGSAARARSPRSAQAPHSAKRYSSSWGKVVGSCRLFWLFEGVVLPGKECSARTLFIPIPSLFPVDGVGASILRYVFGNKLGDVLFLVAACPG